jgi:hypothetical protein
MTTAFRPADLARRWQCSERHVRGLINTGALPSFRLGGKLLRVTIGAIERFEQCQTNTDLSGSEGNSLSFGTKADADFVTRLASTIARTQIEDSLSS